MYDSIYLNIMRKCASCGSNFPINGLAENLDCPHCEAPYELDEGFWKMHFEDEIEDALGFDEGQATGGTIMSGYGTSNYKCGRLTPKCPECEATVVLDGLTRETTELPCPSCEFLLPVRPATEIAKALHSRAFLLVGEYGVGDNARELERKTEPVMFACLQCGAGLSVDGSSRNVQCQYCDASNYLPEGLWRQLNPVPTVEEFYLILESEQAYQQRRRAEFGRFRNLATNPSTPLEEQRRIAGHDAREIREALASNTTHPEIWKSLTEDDVARVRAAALSNDHFRGSADWQAAIEANANEPNDDLRWALASDARTPTELLERYYENDTDSISNAASNNLGIDPRPGSSDDEPDEFSSLKNDAARSAILLVFMAVGLIVVILVMGYHFL